MALRFGKPSPALVVALIALFVALGGSAIASGIVQIVPRAKFADKAGIANNALKLNGKTAGQIVASVPVPTPTPPLTSVASFTSVKSAPFTINADAAQNVTATCDAGSKAVGGGFSSTSPTAPALSFGSFPTADGGGWTEFLVNISSSATATGNVYATCIK